MGWLDSLRRNANSRDAGFPRLPCSPGESRGGSGRLTDRRLLTSMKTMFQLPFTIRYDKQIKRHLRAIDAKYHSLIRKVIEKQLLFDAETETRNRKPLRQPAPFDATWEIRFGPNNRFRVLYGIDPELREVQIQAIGVKTGSRLIVGGEEIEI